MNEPKPQVEWEMNAWSESVGPLRKGKPSCWSTYTFTSEREAQQTRARLEKKWKKETGAGPYVFDLYRVERTLVPRRRS